MKKRIVSLFMALLMLLPFCLTGCGESTDESAIDDITDAASDSARTLVMYVMTGDETLAEDEEAVSDAISALTESKYKTRLIIKYVTEDEYYDTIEAKLAEMEYHADEGDLWYDLEDEDEDEEAEEEEETVVDEYGITTTKYPEAASYQIDLFYFGGYDKYEEYINNGWLASLNTQLSGTGLLITDYVSPMLLEGVKYKGQTYAIPNNNPIGEYTYLIINREVADKYYYSSDLDNFTDVSSLTVKRFLDDLAGDESFSNLVPFNASFDDCINLLANYWYIDSSTCENVDGKFSIIGSKVTDISLLGRGDSFCEFNNLAGDEEFRTSLARLAYYNIEGYFGQTDGTDFGLSIVKGDSSVLEQYDSDKYYSVILRYPEAVDDDLYGNMFGICANTQTLSRAVEIITYINTNAEARNLLQYGIENVNYTLNEEGVVERLNHNYMMDIAKTGNMFLAYPDPDAGYAANAWEAAKKQNQEALLNVRLGFTFSENTPADTPLDTTKISTVNGYSDNILKALKNASTQEEIDAVITEMSTKYTAADVSINYMIDSSTKLKTSAKTASPYYVYFTWAKTYKYLTAELQAAVEAAEKAASESED